jgi:hypothetical protein
VKRKAKDSSSSDSSSEDEAPVAKKQANASLVTPFALQPGKGNK